MNEKKKILYFVESFSGGVFYYMIGLTQELVDDYDICIAYATREETPENFRSFFDERIKFVRVKNFQRELSLVKDVKAFSEMRRIAKKFKPDIIHLHSSKAGALGRFAFNGRQVPLFYTPHGYSFLMSDQSKLKRNIYRLIEKICAKRNCVTINCSKGEYEQGLKLSKRSLCVSNGIDTKQVDRVVANTPIEPKEGKTLFILGRVDPSKNPELFNSIAMRFPNNRFVWVGDGVQRDRLTAPNIEITGWADREEALTHVCQGDILLMTSRWEGLPLSLLEAMYMRKLCIVSNVVGNRDVIKDGVNGYVCDGLEEFAARIEKCLNEDCSEVIERGHEDVIEHYTTLTMSKGYRDIYEKAINARADQADRVKDACGFQRIL